MGKWARLVAGQIECPVSKKLLSTKAPTSSQQFPAARTHSCSTCGTGQAKLANTEKSSFSRLLSGLVIVTPMQFYALLSTLSYQVSLSSAAVAAKIAENNMPYLPTELLSKIFNLCLPEFPEVTEDGELMLPSSLEAPMLLTGVCRRWGEVAVGYAQFVPYINQILSLWINIGFHADKPELMLTDSLSASGANHVHKGRGTSGAAHP
ncbi:hypothetical protein EDB19DRAFT_1837097 [Suillus lakei]|nr:hypothetical protein EDB19DRAFT_1837097 [Suillus lakei]